MATYERTFIEKGIPEEFLARVEHITEKGTFKSVPNDASKNSLIQADQRMAPNRAAFLNPRMSDTPYIIARLGLDNESDSLTTIIQRMRDFEMVKPIYEGKRIPCFSPEDVYLVLELTRVYQALLEAKEIPRLGRKMDFQLAIDPMRKIVGVGLKNLGDSPLGQELRRRIVSSE